MSEFVESLSCFGQVFFYTILLLIPVIWRLGIVLNRLGQIELTNENFKEVFRKFTSRFIELLCLFVTHIITLFKLYNEIYEDAAISAMSEILVFLFVIGAFVILFIFAVSIKDSGCKKAD